MTVCHEQLLDKVEDYQHEVWDKVEALYGLGAPPQGSKEHEEALARLWLKSDVCNVLRDILRED